MLSPDRTHAALRAFGGGRTSDRSTCSGQPDGVGKFVGSPTPKRAVFSVLERKAGTDNQSSDRRAFRL